MQYYNKSTGVITQNLPDYTVQESCRDYGFYPLYDEPFDYDLRYYTRESGAIVYNEFSDTYSQTWIPVLLPLDNVKYWKRLDFSDVFTRLEAREARPTSALTLRLTEGETSFPDDDFDAGLLWSIEQIKQANRDLLAGLEAMIIPDEATQEEAQAIIAEAVAVVPWVPETYGNVGGVA